jgi:hypothetical protein
MAILLIGETEAKRVAEIVAYAKAHPLSFETIREGAVPETETVRLKDRKPGFERPRSQHIMFPGGYHAAFSIEEQAFGLCTHLSISVEGRAKKGMMPSPQAVQMIAETFGVPFPADKMWQEEFDPGEFAVNLLSLYAPKEEGHA